MQVVESTVFFKGFSLFELKEKNDRNKVNLTGKQLKTY